MQSCHIGMHWDHGWIKGTPFEEIDDLVFYDFAIHWFDFLVSLIGDRATSVFATRARARGQSVRPPLLAQALVAFDGGQAALLFDGATRFGAEDRTIVSGSAGTLTSRGPDLSNQEVTLTTAAGVARPKLEGTWFKEGFRGTMGALLKAVEDGTQPENAARRNLDALALVFAAIASARRQRPGDAGKRPQPRRRARVAALPNRPVVRGGRRRTAQDESVPISLDGRSALRKIPRHRTCAEHLYVEKENTAEPIRTGHPRATCSKWRAIRVLH